MSDGSESLEELLVRLDRLEDLLEEMTEIGIDSRADLEAIILALHQRLDRIEADGQ